jgi:hypothetical protein
LLDGWEVVSGSDAGVEVVLGDVAGEGGEGGCCGAAPGVGFENWKARRL